MYSLWQVGSRGSLCVFFQRSERAAGLVVSIGPAEYFTSRWLGTQRLSLAESGFCGVLGDRHRDGWLLGLKESAIVSTIVPTRYSQFDGTLDVQTRAVVEMGDLALQAPRPASPRF